MNRLCPLILWIAIMGTPLMGTPVIGQERLAFNRDVRPILSANCFRCHGPDEQERQAELRLDEASGIAKVFRSETLAASPAWQRIISPDPDVKMPPADSHLELKAEEVATLKRWIQEGASWEGHWSFQPPRRVEVPADSLPDDLRAWVRNPIDAHVARSLVAQGLHPESEAEREQLIRRVTLDLTGLPPTLEEIDHFLADTSPHAYEKVVDRLLKSPHFGERMALAWMDAARYGDTSVFHADGHREMWAWRDWVINAYNRNLPFDQFTIEQLAGDLLDSPSLEQRIATGFLRNNATTDEGGAIAEEFRVEYAVDRVKTTSMIWMGLTLECAQCHDHKYDPISQREYYQYFAFFNQAADPGMQTRNGNQAPLAELPNEQALAQRARQVAELDKLRQWQTDYQKSQASPFEAWLAKLKPESTSLAVPADALLYLPLDGLQGDQQAPDALSHNTVAIRESATRGKAKFVPGKFGNAFESGPDRYLDLGQLANHFEFDRPFSYGAWIKTQGNVSGAPLAKMNEAKGYRGFDLLLSGNQIEAHLVHQWPTNAIKVKTKARVPANGWHQVQVTYDGSAKASGLKIYLDGKRQEVNVEADQLSDSIKTDAPLVIGRRTPGFPFPGLIDEVRFYDRELTAAEVGQLANQDPIATLLTLPRESWTPSQMHSVREHFLVSQYPEYRSNTERIAELEGITAKPVPPLTTVMVMSDVNKPRMTYILDRGQYDSPKKDQPVEPSTPAFLPSLPAHETPTRLTLARWLVSGQHPLTARVTVNRYWHMLFGKGLVKTVEDFGSQGAWPTHPELLDWLALDFVDHDWDIKRTLKQMVMSSTYRQSSRTSEAKLEADPQNIWLSRGARFRLAGEFIRDASLAAADLLVPQIGGPGVKPYQPPGLWNEVSINTNLRFVQDHQDKLYRRSMYTYWKRSAPAPSMAIFDVPTRDQCVLRRSRTNTPLQALVTLNDVQFIEAARALAERVRALEGSLEDQIATAYRLATACEPPPATLELLVRTYHEELAEFQRFPQRAEQLIQHGESKPRAGNRPQELAAMTIVTSIILNLDAFLTRG